MLNQYDYFSNDVQFDIIRNFVMAAIKSFDGPLAQMASLKLFENLMETKIRGENCYSALDNIKVRDYDDFEDLWGKLSEKPITFRNGNLMTEHLKLNEIKDSIENAYNFTMRCYEIEVELATKKIQERRSNDKRRASTKKVYKRG